MERRPHCRITSIYDTTTGENMTSIELSIWIESNCPISGTGRPRKPLYGVGVNDAHYATQPMVNGVKLMDPAYQSWSDMLKRAYNRKYQVTHPTYVGVTVCKEWHSFTAFRDWWLTSYREGLPLDKDLLVVGNREYGPDACVYVPRWLNNFTEDHGAGRGEFQIGVSIHNQTGKYQSRCSNPITGNKHHLGLFSTPEAAHEAWRRYKLSLAEQLKPEMDSIDHRIHPNVISIIKAAQ